MHGQTFVRGPSASAAGMPSNGARTLMAWVKRWQSGSASIVHYGSSGTANMFSLRGDDGRESAAPPPSRAGPAVA